MLGKLLKKEAFEKKRIVTIYLVVLFAVAGLYALTSIIKESINSAIFDFTAAFTLMLFVLLAIGSVVVIFAVSVGDYSKTCFKDEGYLTNTLPVTSGQIILSKMIMDAVITIVIVALMPLAVSIAMRDMSIYGDCTVRMIKTLLEVSDADVTVLQKVITGISLIVLILFGLISNIWMFNTAITFGNCTNGNRKIVGVAAYFVIYAILQVISVIIMGIATLTEIPDWYTSLDVFAQINLLFLLLNAYFVFITIAFGVISAKVLKNKINIE